MYAMKTLLKLLIKNFFYYENVNGCCIIILEKE